MQDEIFTFLHQFIIRIKRELKPSDVTPQSTVVALGLDSLDFAELHVELMERYQFDFFRNKPKDFKNTTLQQLVEQVVGQ
ncbi:acyl carrier protein [Shewanella sp.]|uniref:acyl carrier protein n=1 Tax=Shewanella sp. TaxID=50422 RepID=UPI001EC8F1F6|nr:acyl carrier protein [Shewanella sp.]NRB22280.1 acyl carrier protein [Shewanella sp.]